MTIQKIAFALTVLGMTAGAVPAVAANSMNERPQKFMFDEATDKTEIVAGNYFTPKELSRRGLEADDIIAISDFSSESMIDRTSRGDL